MPERKRVDHIMKKKRKKNEYEETYKRKRFIVRAKIIIIGSSVDILLRR